MNIGNFQHYLGSSYGLDQYNVTTQDLLATGSALHTDEMQTLIQEIIAYIPGTIDEPELTQLPPEKLVPILIDRLNTFFLSRGMFSSLEEFGPLWEGFMNALRTLDVFLKLDPKAKGNHFKALQDAILEKICLMPSTEFITEYYRLKVINNPKFNLDDLILLKKIEDAYKSGTLGFKWIDRDAVKIKLRSFQSYILGVIREETHHLPRALKENERWTVQDYEMMCDFIQVISNCLYEYTFTSKLKSIILRSLLYSTPVEFKRDEKSADRELRLDPTVFTATPSRSLLRVLEEISTLDKSFYDYELHPLLEQFNHIMDESPVEVRKIYHRFKLNILEKIAADCLDYPHQNPFQPALRSPKSVVRNCWLCLHEMADIDDNKRQEEIDSILKRILRTTILVRDRIDFTMKKKELIKILTPEEASILLNPDLNRFLAGCQKLLQKDNSANWNGINFTQSPQFNDLVAKSICSRESAWSVEGIEVMRGFKHPDIPSFVEEYKHYLGKFEQYGHPDKSITINRQTIFYHSFMVPEYIIEDIRKDSSISSKGVRAILFGFYCGWEEDSTLFRYWKKDWMDAVTKIHPEIAEEPAAFFKHYFSEDFDQMLSEFFEKIVKDFGPTDVSLRVEGRLIPAHRKILQSYCSLLPPNYFSGLFSGFKESGVIDLDHSGYVGAPVSIPLTYRGVSLLLMDIYYLKKSWLNLSTRTFRDEWKCSRNYLFPGIESFTLLEHHQSHKLELFNLALQSILNTKLSTNPSVLADALADLYEKYRNAQLMTMCEETFRIAVGTLDNLMDLIQQKVYPELYVIQIKVNLEEEQKSLFRNKAFNFMKAVEGKMSYDVFNNDLVYLIRMLTFAEVKRVTEEEFSTLTAWIKHLASHLPVLILDTREMIDLKNNIQNNWDKLNKILGTNIAFVIDMGE